jgi:hypothetical protein
VFEFVSTEHTAKNVMITAVKTADGGPASAEATAGKTVDGGRWTADGKRRSDALAKVAALKAGFGIEEHYLERLL